VSLPASGALPATHSCALGLQTGFPVGQSESLTHSTHEPPAHTLPAALPAQSPLLLQGPQLPVDPQMGLGLWHWESLVQMHA